ncbi:MAG: hypothetical protein WCY09_08975 [Candidatus Omnitrophota bacterium]|jgi:antitoxin component of MazEF toxin-antitoxin module
MIVTKKLITIGNSVAVTIPDWWIKTHVEYALKEGEKKQVSMDLKDDGTIIISPAPIDLSGIKACDED